jgi:hypothetical protein
MPDSPAPNLCPQCGGPNPLGATVCQWCRSALPVRSTGYHPLEPVVPAKDPPGPFPWPAVYLLLALLIMFIIVVYLVI